MSTEDRAKEQVDNVEGYALLRGVLEEAYDQSARGKGHARHANGRYFEQQPIMEIGRMVGVGFAAGQVMKKAQEAVAMAARGETEAAEREWLGVIVYAASAKLLTRESAPCAVTDRRRHEAASPEPRPFKVGDRLRWKGRWRSSYYTKGEVYEIKSGPHPDGKFGLTDDVQDTGAHSWDSCEISENFERVN